MENLTADSLRRRYTDETFAYLPKLFQMVDRNQYSPTYGCFDRSFWHYRTMDFPCGMYQEFCLPLALAYQHPFPDNPYFKIDRVKELAIAGVNYAAISSHRDGTCDDYFPYERALGALVFSLNAMCETLITLDHKPADLLEFISKRANYLAKHNESGQLTNHQALAALALYGSWQLTGETHLLEASQKYVNIVRQWQSSEGWFREYEGADPGYHTCTISFLAKLYKNSGDESLLKIMNPAVDFAWHFMHPDGSYAGEYGSRNTYHFYPYGFEVMAPFNTKAAQIADHFLQKAIPNRTRYFNDDDRMCAHYLYDWMHSYLDFSHIRSEISINDTQPYTRWFSEAGVFVKKNNTYHAVLNLKKGGVLKVFDKQGPIYSDTGIIAKTNKNEVIVSHIVQEDNSISADMNTLTFSVSGNMCRRKSKYSSPVKQILFRVLNMTMGMFSENLLRSFLQKVLITGKHKTDFSFCRKFSFNEDDITVLSRLTRHSSTSLVSAHIASDATSIYVANSNVYQNSVLLPWIPLEKLCSSVNTENTGTAEITVKDRSFSIN